MFLRSLSGRITRPVMPDDEPFEYLATQAIADFLFNYKMSVQYPHQFNPYDLGHTADALNNTIELASLADRLLVGR